LDLELESPRRGSAQVSVGECVHADLVTFRNDAAYELGVVDRRRANHEERSVNVMLPQDVEDSGRPDGVRSVVESQRERTIRRTHGADRPAAGIDDRTAVGDGVRDGVRGRTCWHGVIADSGEMVHVSLHREGNTQREQEGYKDEPMRPHTDRNNGLDRSGHAHGWGGADGRVVWPGAVPLLPGDVASVIAACGVTGAERAARSTVLPLTDGATGTVEGPVTGTWKAAGAGPAGTAC